MAPVSVSTAGTSIALAIDSKVKTTAAPFLFVLRRPDMMRPAIVLSSSLPRCRLIDDCLIDMMIREEINEEGAMYRRVLRGAE